MSDETKNEPKLDTEASMSLAEALEFVESLRKAESRRRYASERSFLSTLVVVVGSSVVLTAVLHALTARIQNPAVSAFMAGVYVFPIGAFASTCAIYVADKRGKLK